MSPDPDPGVQRPTIADVARRAGVSPKTVSRVLTGEGAVRPDTAARVWAAAAQLRYRRNEEAASLRRGSPAPLVGIVVGDLADPTSAGMVVAAEHVARSHGYVAVVAASGHDEMHEQHVVLAMCRRGVNGLILVPSSADLSYLRPEIATGLPVVLVEGAVPDLRADSVVVAHADGARKATTHLVEEGHLRVAFLGGPAAAFATTERLRGYREALAAAGVPESPQLERLDLRSAADAEAAVTELLAGPDPPTAAFATSTPLTIGAVRAVQTATAVMSLAGFDDHWIADLLPVPVTLVRQDPAALGRTAAELLVHRIGGDRRPFTHVSLDPELIDRSRPIPTF